MRSSVDIHFSATDVDCWFSDNLNMAQPEKHLWYLQEWFATVGKIQRSLVTDLGWLPAKANKVWHGIQEPRASEIHEVAAMLNIAPHELMMHPDDAMAIRRLRSAVEEVTRPAAVSDRDQTLRTGTQG